MKLSATSIAVLALIPFASCAPQTARASPRATKANETLAELFKVDGDHWLQAVREEAARQASATNETEQVQGASRYKVHATYTDNLINLGNVDIFNNLWQRMYDVSDDRGGLSDRTTGARSKFCNAANAGDTVDDRFILDGQWGAVNGVNGWSMRDALIHSMWETARSIAAETSYPVYTDCVGFTWQEPKPNNKNSACGPVARTKCPHNDDCPLENMECSGVTTGHWLPSIMRINIYNLDGSLRADAYQARISSQALGSGGCSKEANVAGAVAGFVPVAGPYFAAGISIQCIFQG